MQQILAETKSMRGDKDIHGRVRGKISVLGRCRLGLIMQKSKEDGTACQKLRIANDMDETLADTLEHHLALYNRDSGERLTKAHCGGRVFADVVEPRYRERISECCHAAEFWRDIRPMAGADAILAKLVARHEVFFVSAAIEYPASLGPKYEWIKKNSPFFPDMHIVFCGDKSVIATDYMIDDHARHFGRYKGIGLLYDAPHNCDERRYPRLRDWTEIGTRFLPETDLVRL